MTKVADQWKVYESAWLALDPEQPEKWVACTIVKQLGDGQDFQVRITNKDGESWLYPAHITNKDGESWLYPARSDQLFTDEERTRSLLRKARHLIDLAMGAGSDEN